MRIGCTVFLIMSLAGSAQAHGGTPVAHTIVVHPSNPSHVLVTTQFGGFFVTRNAGKSWEWVCEQAVGYADVEPPPTTLTAGGITVSSLLFTGIATAPSEGCSFSVWNPGETRPVFPDVRLDPHDSQKVVALRSELTNGAYVSQIWRGDPGAAAWSRIGESLATDFIGRTVAVAPSDANRIYASGGFLNAENKTEPVLETSSNGGASFQRYTPGLEGELRLIAVKPDDADVVFARLIRFVGRDEYVDRIVVFTQAGTVHHEAFEGVGSLPAAALSPDGSELLIGGPQDGIYGAPTAALAAGQTGAFSKRADVRTGALTWTADFLYSGGREKFSATSTDEGFTVGRSRDGGQTFEPFLILCKVAGPVSCSEEVGGACPLEGENVSWGDMRNYFAQLPCAQAPEQTAEEDGCACRAASAPTKAWPVAASIFFVVLPLARRRAQRQRSARGGSHGGMKRGQLAGAGAMRISAKPSPDSRS